MYLKFYFLCYDMQENEKLSCFTTLRRKMEILWIYLKFNHRPIIYPWEFFDTMCACKNNHILVHFNILTNFLPISLLFFKIVYKVLSYICSLQLPHHNFVLSLKFPSFQQQNIQERLNLDYCGADKPEFYDVLP